MARTKPFAPQPFEPGARITWMHFYPDGDYAERSGTVWDRAPGVDGATVVVWVTPDEHLPTDLYRLVAVGKATRMHPAHGRYIDGAKHQYVNKGFTFASNYANSPTGRLAAHAARIAYETRRDARAASRM